MILVLGLGNPGRRYVNTRHNVGFLVVDRLAGRQGCSITRNQLGAQVETVGLGTERAILAKPQSFMNLSGQVAASLRGYYKVENDAIVVVHDDVDLPFGDVRLKVGGGHGGHNGLRDLKAKLGREGFVRVRVGVSRPPPGWDTADYVLGQWTAAEAADLDSVVDAAADAVTLVAEQGVVAAMNRVNVRRGATDPDDSGSPGSGTSPQRS